MTIPDQDEPLNPIEIQQHNEQKNTLYNDILNRLGNAQVINIASDEEVDWLKDSPFETEFLGKVVK